MNENINIKGPFDKLAICINWRAGSMLPSCGDAGSRDVAEAIEKGLKENNISLEFKKLHCMGKCHLGPTMRLAPRGPFIMGAQLDDVPQILTLLKEENYEELADAFPLSESV